jgi:hypothetical protein
MIDKLRIISADRITAFESHSPERAEKLAQEILHDGKLKNPVLVCTLGDKFLILDDVSILEALRLLDVVHIPVQVADVGGLSVHPWQRVVENWHEGDLLEFCARFPRQVRVLASPQEELSRHDAEVHFKNKAVYRLSFSSSSVLVRADICAKFCSCMAAGHKSFRTKLNHRDADPLRAFARASAAFFPPVFTIAELAAMALRDIRLPQGIVRIDLPGRLLGIDYSLTILQENVSPDDKEAFLKHLIHMRMSSDRIAYYNGAVFMFNN